MTLAAVPRQRPSQGESHACVHQRRSEPKGGQEFDQAILNQPEQLQQQIRHLYAQAQQAMDDQIHALDPIPAMSPQVSPPTAAGSGGNGQAHKPISDSQRQAILAIARRLDVNPELQSISVIDVRLEMLSRPQASKLIDYLDGLAPAELSGRTNGNGH